MPGIILRMYRQKMSIPFITEKDPAPVYLNKEKMAPYRSEMKKYYYTPLKYKTYMEQLGIVYPTLEKK